PSKCSVNIWRNRSGTACVYEHSDGGTMSTETIKHPPLVTGARANAGTGRTLIWLKQFWARIWAGKKTLLIGGGIVAAFLLAGLYFWGDAPATAQYLTARVERG